MYKRNRSVTEIQEEIRECNSLITELKEQEVSVDCINKDECKLLVKGKCIECKTFIKRKKTKIDSTKRKVNLLSYEELKQNKENANEEEPSEPDEVMEWRLPKKNEPTSPLRQGETLLKRTMRHNRKHLFVEKSHYYAKGDPTKSSIGGAGYCGIEIKEPGHLVRYTGKVVSLNADGYAALVTKYGGKPEYLLWMGGHKNGYVKYLDCYESAMNGTCFASKVNRSSGLIPMENTIPPAKKNCKVVVNLQAGEIWLMVIAPIAARRELLTCYGSGFSTTVGIRRRTWT